MTIFGKIAKIIVLSRRNPGFHPSNHFYDFPKIDNLVGYDFHKFQDFCEKFQKSYIG